MLTSDSIADALSTQFATSVRLREKRPNVMQVFTPFVHEDGDMLDMYLTERDGRLRVCDFGKTLMRLSYNFELDTDNKVRIFHDLLAQNGVDFDEANGHIYLDTTTTSVGAAVMHFSQVIAKVSRLDILRRENVSALFFEMVQEFISESLKQFNPQFKIHPLPGRDDIEVPFVFAIGPRPVYLFAVRRSAQATDAAYSFMAFQQEKLPFKGYVVHEDLDRLPAKARKRVTSAADKQFVSLEDFREHAAQFLERDAA